MQIMVPGTYVQVPFFNVGVICNLVDFVQINLVEIVTNTFKMYFLFLYRGGDLHLYPCFYFTMFLRIL